MTQLNHNLRHYYRLVYPALTFAQPEYPFFHVSSKGQLPSPLSFSPCSLLFPQMLTASHWLLLAIGLLTCGSVRAPAESISTAAPPSQLPLHQLLDDFRTATRKSATTKLPLDLAAISRVVEQHKDNLLLLQDADLIQQAFAAGFDALPLAIARQACQSSSGAARALLLRQWQQAARSPQLRGYSVLHSIVDPRSHLMAACNVLLRPASQQHIALAAWEIHGLKLPPLNNNRWCAASHVAPHVMRWIVERIVQWIRVLHNCKNKASEPLSAVSQTLAALPLTPRGQTPLHLAARFTDVSVVETLLETSPAAWLTQRDVTGYTPFHAALIANQPTIAVSLFCGVPTEAERRALLDTIDVQAELFSSPADWTLLLPYFRAKTDSTDASACRQGLTADLDPHLPRRDVNLPALDAQAFEAVVEEAGSQIATHSTLVSHEQWFVAPQSSSFLRNLPLTASCGIDVRPAAELTAEEFKTKYLAPGRPILIQGGAQHWPAMQHWAQPQKLSSDLGSHKLQCSRIPYARQYGLPQSQMTLDDFLHLPASESGVYVFDNKIFSTNTSLLNGKGFCLCAIQNPSAKKIEDFLVTASSLVISLFARAGSTGVVSQHAHASSSIHGGAAWVRRSIPLSSSESELCLSCARLETPFLLVFYPDWTLFLT